MSLKVDPFTPNAPIDDPARFSGRDTELEAIIDALYQTAHGNPHHVAITGARGIGKTSALNMAGEVAGGDRSLLDRIRKALDQSGFETKELRWEINLKLFKVGGSAGPALVPQIVDQLLDN